MNKFIASIEDAVINEDKIWFFEMNFNGLFSKTIGGDIKFCGSVPWEPLDGKRLYASIQQFEGKLFMIPCNAKSVAIYDINEETFYRIDLRLENDLTSFMASAIYKNYLFMFGFYSPYIVRINLNNSQILYFDKWYETAKKYIWDEKAPFFRRQLLQKGSAFLIPFFNANALLEFDTESFDYRIHDLGAEKKGYSGICEWNEKVICLSHMRDDAILIFDDDKDFQIHRSDTSLIGYNSHFSGILNLEGNLNIFSLFLPESKNIQISDNILLKQGDYLFVRNEGEISYYYNRCTGDLFIFNKVNHKIVKEKIEVNTIYLNLSELNTHFISQEDSREDLKEFFKYILYDSKKYSIENAIENGNRVFEYLKLEIS